MHVKNSSQKDWSRFVWTDEDLEPEASGPVRPGETLRPDPVWVLDLGLLRLIWKFGERLPSGRRGRPRVEGRERVLRVVMTDEEWKRLKELARLIRALTHRSVSEGTLLGLIGSEWLERARLRPRGSEEALRERLWNPEPEAEGFGDRPDPGSSSRLDAGQVLAAQILWAILQVRRTVRDMGPPAGWLDMVKQLRDEDPSVRAAAANALGAMGATYPEILEALEELLQVKRTP